MSSYDQQLVLETLLRIEAKLDTLAELVHTHEGAISALKWVFATGATITGLLIAFLNYKWR